MGDVKAMRERMGLITAWHFIAASVILTIAIACWVIPSRHPEFHLIYATRFCVLGSFDRHPDSCNGIYWAACRFGP